MFFKYIFNLNVYLTFLLGLITVLGDYVVSHSKIHVFQAIFDNATHAVVGGLSWFIVCINCRKGLTSLQVVLETAICSLFASFIDIDHFIAAKSLSLKDATNLTGRPVLHCSTFPLATCILFVMLSYLFQWPMIKRYTLIVLVAFASHHTRDATRRGYWFYPYGSTSPLPYGIYVLTSCIIPYFVCFLYECINVGTVNYSKLSVI